MSIKDKITLDLFVQNGHISFTTTKQGVLKMLSGNQIEVLEIATSRVSRYDDKILGIKCMYDGVIPEGAQRQLDRLQSNRSHWQMHADDARLSITKSAIKDLTDEIMACRASNSVPSSEAYYKAIEVSIIMDQVGA